jgi:glycosyltransferase 2 family protein
MHEDLGKPRKRFPTWLMPSVGYTLSAISLIWVIHSFNLKQTLSDLASLDWRYVSIAVVFELSVYLCHAWRWNILLGSVARPSYWRSVQAIYIGLYANDVLPLRTGEVIRCYLVSHWNDIPISLSISSAVIERLLDGIWLVISFFITSRLVPLPAYLVEGTDILAIGLCALLGLLIFVAVHKQKAQEVISESSWASGLRHIVEGVHAMGNRRTMLATIIPSLGYLILQVVPVWALMESFGLDLSIWAAAVVVVVIRFGTVIPSAPGNIGLQQYFCVMGLKLFYVPDATAFQVANVMFGVLTLPLLMGGLVALALAGLKLGDIRTRAHSSVRPAAEAAAD